MKSSEGKYFAKLDHVRAFAAYLVFVWHFTHLTAQFPVPAAASPYFPFALLEEGHTGVALFMTLSGGATNRAGQPLPQYFLSNDQLPSPTSTTRQVKATVTIAGTSLTTQGTLTLT